MYLWRDVWAGVRVPAPPVQPQPVQEEGGLGVQALVLDHQVVGDVFRADRAHLRHRPPELVPKLACKWRFYLDN